MGWVVVWSNLAWTRFIYLLIYLCPTLSILKQACLPVNQARRDVSTWVTANRTFGISVLFYSPYGIPRTSRDQSENFSWSSPQHFVEPKTNHITARLSGEIGEMLMLLKHPIFQYIYPHHTTLPKIYIIRGMFKKIDEYCARSFPSVKYSVLCKARQGKQEDFSILTRRPARSAHLSD